MRKDKIMNIIGHGITDDITDIYSVKSVYNHDSSTNGILLTAKDGHKAFISDTMLKLAYDLISEKERRNDIADILEENGYSTQDIPDDLFNSIESEYSSKYNDKSKWHDIAADIIEKHEGELEQYKTAER